MDFFIAGVLLNFVLFFIQGCHLKYIVEKIHSTVFATMDGEGRTAACAIDIMGYDENVFPS